LVRWQAEGQQDVRDQEIHECFGNDRLPGTVIEDNKSSEFEAAKSKLVGKETLLITDHRGLGAKGSCINFKLVDAKLRFELNQRAIEESKLKVSSMLSQMAIMI